MLTSPHASRNPPSPQDEDKAKYTNLGGCFVGIVVGSMVGLPLVLAHAGTIKAAALGYWLGSSGVLALCAIAYFSCRPVKSRY